MMRQRKSDPPLIFVSTSQTLIVSTSFSHFFHFLDFLNFGVFLNLSNRHSINETFCPDGGKICGSKLVIQHLTYMLRVSLSIVLGLLLASLQAQEIPDRAGQIAQAVQAAAADQRDAATVMGYDAEGQLRTLRKGSNGLICLADDPNRPGFQVVAYHQDLEEFMARGRVLKAEGKSPKEIFDMREAEAKAGKLNMPDHPATLHLLEGKEASFNPETGKVEGAFYRYVVYIPWATAASTGLPTRPLVPGGPWIMDPGTHRAHIMVSPPRETQKPKDE